MFHWGQSNEQSHCHHEQGGSEEAGHQPPQLLHLRRRQVGGGKHNFSLLLECILILEWISFFIKKNLKIRKFQQQKISGNTYKMYLGME